MPMMLFFRALISSASRQSPSPRNHESSRNVALTARDPCRGGHLSRKMQRGRRGDRRETGADARF
jgi:hypothetical protein